MESTDFDSFTKQFPLHNRRIVAAAAAIVFWVDAFFPLSKLYIENVTWFRFVCTFVPLFGMCMHFIWFLLPNDQ